MIVEIISTGTELLLGEILDTNAQYLSARLNELGYDVLYRTTVGDNHVRMLQVLETAVNRADIIITTGGLGPTQGDITKEITAEFCAREMQISEHSLQKIKDFFSKRDVCMPISNSKQAMFAAGSTILENNYGTAPGMMLEHNGRIIMNLPGPPRELKGVFEECVVPFLRTRYGSLGIIYSHTLRSIGLGESSIAELLEDLISEQHNPTIALYARDGEILIRLTAKAESEQEAQELISMIEEKVRARVGDYIFGVDEQSLQTVVGNLLLENQLTISLAESCTAGMITSLLADISGSSHYLKGAIVSYANESKMRELGVNAKDLETYGAVSEQVAVQMAEGICRRMNTDVGVGITGIAGPEGGTDDKPVGLVYIAINFRGKTVCTKNMFASSGSRSMIRVRAAKMTLFNVWKQMNSHHLTLAKQ